MTDFQKSLISLVRLVLQDYFKGQKTVIPGTLLDFPEAQQVQGAFVTLKKSGLLRGCIGNISPDVPVPKLIKHLALESAFDDPRFPPVEEYELPNIRVEISLLTPPKRITNLEDFHLGDEGIILQKGNHRALFLPQVATEQGWDQETTLRQLCRKAGIPQDSWKEESCHWETFSAVVFGEEH